MGNALGYSHFRPYANGDESSGFQEEKDLGLMTASAVALDTPPSLNGKKRGLPPQK